jgi:hypothetical protein
MKNKIIALIVGMVLLMTFFTACKKNEIPSEVRMQDNYLYKIIDGRVQFKSIESYRLFLDNMTDKTRQQFIKEVGDNRSYIPARESNKWNNFNSTSRLTPTGTEEVDDDIKDMMDSEFLSHLINADGLVQIGTYLFNIDLTAKKCYALHTSWLSGDSAKMIYDYLYNGNESNIYVFGFSTNQEVLEELEVMGFPRSKKDITQSPNGLFCRDRRAYAQKKMGLEPFEYPNHFYRHKAKVNYQVAGIYFALYGKIIQQYNDCNYSSRTNGLIPCHWVKGWWRSNTIMFNWKFKPRCWSERYQPPATETSYTDQERKTWAWESSRALSKYDITFQWKADGILCEGRFHTTQIYHITDGY